MHQTAPPPPGAHLRMNGLFHEVVLHAYGNVSIFVGVLECLFHWFLWISIFVCIIRRILQKVLGCAALYSVISIFLNNFGGGTNLMLIFSFFWRSHSSEFTSCRKCLERWSILKCLNDKTDFLNICILSVLIISVKTAQGEGSASWTTQQQNCCHQQWCHSSSRFWKPIGKQL